MDSISSRLVSAVFILLPTAVAGTQAQKTAENRAWTHSITSHEIIVPSYIFDSK